MSRTIAASIITKLSQDTVYPFYAVDMNFDSTPIYAWTGLGEISKNHSIRPKPRTPNHSHMHSSHTSSHLSHTRALLRHDTDMCLNDGDDNDADDE